MSDPLGSPVHTNTLTLAQLSDIHLGPLPLIPLRLLNAKRLAGTLNWHRKRRHTHLPSVADALLRDVIAAGVDHIAVTGDLTNIGLPSEILRAAQWLEQLGAPHQVSAIPGNHDIYSTVHGRRLGVAGLDAWRPNFASNAEGLKYAGNEPFPFVRVLGSGALRVALIGLNSAIETPPMIAHGQLGRMQLAALERILVATRADGLIRAVMLHHPPLPNMTAPHHELRDAAALAGVLARHGAELVIHGHNHRRMINSLTGPSGAIPIVGAPSASAARSHKGENLARAHLFEFRTQATGQRPHITLIARGLTAERGQIAEVERLVL